MKVKLLNAPIIFLDYSGDLLTGYYLISNHWTVLNDVYITFVRRKGIGYCYNVTWAGPLTKSEAEKLSCDNETILAVRHDVIKPFLQFLDDEVFLPNSVEVRTIIGLDCDQLNLAN
ncbi:MAG: hypothetical protein PHF81_10975 [Flavobacterium sp.]|jgi:hypothetical protein|nr:hypothetical protein [Flavobacterium sp.]